MALSTVHSEPVYLLALIPILRHTRPQSFDNNEWIADLE